MQKRGLTSCLLIFCLLAAWRSEAGAIYYNTSSSTLAQNTLARVGTNGSGNTLLLTATGIDGNKLNRCTAVAVDGLNGKFFLLDGAANSLWSANLNGSGLALVKSGLTGFPTDLALDVQHQIIYYTTSSTLQNSNTVQSIDYTGNNNSVVFTATGTAGNGVSRCTALAVDVLNSKIFIADAGSRKIWSMSLAGSGLTSPATLTTSTPTDVALDAASQQVYFSASSPVQSSNFVERVSYGGSGLTTLFTASGSVQRCTALDLDSTHGAVYLSDAGAGALWRVPIAGGATTAILNGLTGTAKKLRWFSVTSAPAIVGISFSGDNVIFNGTNGYVGGTYEVLSSTNVALPLSQWSPISTNALAAPGNFIITATNGVISSAPSQFYILQVQ
ncbi:MAG TPA: hypothetical protein VG938_20630 [Verrucomicrobiae bacterium]|jgi:hypothetical protein|nr:hypothetical protein [Verrucomicrobiae bacterium]